MTVYYASRVLKNSEVNYSPIEKMAFSLVTTARKLRQYFLTYPIIVLTNTLLEKNLKRLDRSGRMLSWSIELLEFDIAYKPRAAIKGQALADFVVECTAKDRTVEEPREDALMIRVEPAYLPTPMEHRLPQWVIDGSGYWAIHTDGSVTSVSCGIDIVIEDPHEPLHEYGIRLAFPVTNNVAEY